MLLTATLLMVPEGRHSTFRSLLSKLSEPSDLLCKPAVTHSSGHQSELAEWTDHYVPQFPLTNTMGVHHGKEDHTQGLRSKRTGFKY